MNWDELRFPDIAPGIELQSVKRDNLTIPLNVDDYIKTFDGH